MVTLKKNKEFQTVFPGIFIKVRATPKDALPGDEMCKNFYIVEIIDRNAKDGRAYSTDMKTFSGDELREMIGAKKREVLKFK